jgi:pimeloyl-ACP methyl ester carboxylesterase
MSSEDAIPSSIFKTGELEGQYLQLYQQVLQLWRVPFTPLDISTPYGVTHINAAGSPESPTMLLLPGFGANSTQWFPNVAALSSQFRVFAIDTNSQPGKSLPTQPLTPSNCADWLTKLLDGLGIEKAHLVGISLGGWLALQFTIQQPERVSRAVLLDPAASFEGMSFAFLRHSFIPFMVHPTRKGLVNYFTWMLRGYHVNEQWGELMIQGILNTRPQPPIRASVFSDAALQDLHVPMMLLIGEQSVIYNPQRVYQRARQLIPNIQAEIIPDASHALNAQAAQLVNEHILQFCQA